jgi:hypothetical protein
MVKFLSARRADPPARRWLPREKGQARRDAGRVDRIPVAASQADDDGVVGAALDAEGRCAAVGWIGREGEADVLPVGVVVGIIIGDHHDFEIEQ